MAVAYVICMDSRDEEDHASEILAISSTEATAEKELLHQAEIHQAAWTTPGYRPGVLIAGPRLISVGEIEFFVKEIPFVG